MPVVKLNRKFQSKVSEHKLCKLFLFPFCLEIQILDSLRIFTTFNQDMPSYKSRLSASD